MAKFRLPPISPLLGSNLSTYLHTLKRGRIEPSQYLKVILTFLIILVGTPFRWYEEMMYDLKIKNRKDPESPVFIIGHWRSGTTFLHNMLCQDPGMAFVTTYQSVFPNNLWSKMIFSRFMKAQMPDTRPGDNVKLRVGYPQEDEFAISNMNPYTYYQFMYFPENYRELYDQFIRFTTGGKVREKWKNDYRKMIKKATFNTAGSIPVMKNPCNSGRIKELLEIYPEAKFIHIVRNPVLVFLSSLKFFTELLPTLWFHQVDAEFIEEMVFEVYELLMHDVLRQKKLIPPENYLEIKFEEFEEDPLLHLERIYDYLKLPSYRKTEPAFKAYLERMEGYRKNRYLQIDEQVVKKINERWGFAMERWDYSIPSNLQLVKKEAVGNR